MNERKEYQIKFRLAASLMEQIENYCAAHDVTVSWLMRQAVKEYLGGNKNDK